LSRKTLNLGILAHIDAGKTTLTERLLYSAGVIEEAGSVDAGTTQTDSLELERQRGITIRSAVASFTIGDVSVNLIDTPGHPDFIAEVERVLTVLDGAVLVISAVEGLQPQTLVLMRALERLHVPTLIFVNKVDRMGAGCDRIVEAIARRSAGQVVPMGSVHGIGTREAQFVPYDGADPAVRRRLLEVLATSSDALLAAYVEDESRITEERLREELVVQVGQARVHPVYFGSAILNAGLDALMEGLVELLPAGPNDSDGPLSGRVFKIERSAAEEKVAYVRMFSGTIAPRDRVQFGHDIEGKVTAVGVFYRGADIRHEPVRAGQIAKLWGLAAVRVGDVIGQPAKGAEQHQFAPPTLETAVAPRRSADRGALRVALAQLAEQDPLINVRQDDLLQELAVSLYGEVQKEVIGATLANDYGIEVTFRESTAICIERPAGVGEAVEILHGDLNPFLATVGLRIAPAAEDSGIHFQLAVNPRRVPMYIYKRVESFAENMTQYVRRALQEGLFGWQVTDCQITMIDSNYSSPDGPPTTRGPLSTARDFRQLTPLVVMQALDHAGTVVCEPIVRVTVEFPSSATSALLAVLARLGAGVESHTVRGEFSTVETVLPVSRSPELQRQLPGLTGGEGVLDVHFAGYRPVLGTPPVRRRTIVNPLNRDEYYMYLSRQGAKE
jgi:ribosomal protection tetracycline resistance protein